MRIILNILLGLVGLLVAAAAGLYVWFWGAPVGLNNLINKQTFEIILDSPELMTGLGFIDNTPLDFHSGKLDSYTKEREEKMKAQLRRSLERLQRYDTSSLKDQERITWEIVTWFYEDLLRRSEFDYGFYRVNQISGVTVSTPQFLTDTHVIVNEKSVKRYLSRLDEFGRVLDEVRARVEDDRANGVVPPDFVIEKAIAGMRAFIAGGAAENPLVTTLPDKLEKIGLSEEKRARYAAEAERLVASRVIPGYERMIALFEDMRADTDSNAGVWRLPRGAEIYAAALRMFTTSDMTAEEIHALGVAEVARIESEMDAILRAEGMAEGSVAERVEILMNDPAHHFANTEEGRAELIAYLVALNEAVMAMAGDYFITLPQQPLEIMRVPEYAQDSSPGGYYRPPALDGSRPGVFNINLKDTADNPRWTLPTLLYHEAAPGHHFQLSASQLVKNVPIIRKVSPFSAYSEGWALYAERIAATDMNLYEDDRLGDLGRLQAEMFRAVRLVVDTGMHAKRWSREEAIAYMRGKTGMTEAEVTREIERYVVWPGQATAYKTGQLAMLKMRADAEAALGDKFDLREFHETMLMNGAMPLGVLGTVVRDWVEAKKAE